MPILVRVDVAVREESRTVTALLEIHIITVAWGVALLLVNNL